MADIKVTGNAGRDGEMKYTTSGSPFMSFSLADSKSRKLENGEWETLAEQWLECTIWGSLAEHYDGKITKGSRLTVYGDFMSRKYEARDGSKGTSLDVNVKGVDIMPSRKGGQQQTSANRAGGFSGGNGGIHGNSSQPAQDDPWATPPTSDTGGGWGNLADSDPAF
ncbi:single-stranded DNA-binding protein [Pseudarthrobacter sp. PS3-L1]|uniref:single-stranded DNA-binding protein n=1 Tax=Pseudarthrobacter sp. PS3-L1 TaxID=3046207 RepID=UPI0024BB910E|nr:single-stranded DNA-binding protein [Pseudarthrobacter sp. PS3-L1]MDJ0321680.1 single-stranded DNA-binding protein [Pseudarthrobacter sp. PS3-L1]